METLQRTANRGSVSTGDGNSLVLESDKSERLHKTPSGAGNRRTFTISFWTKRTEINGVKQYLLEAGNSDSNTDRFTLRFGTGDTFDIQSSSTWLVTNRVFRDIAAWYHFVIKVDTTDGTAANRIKLYVNGVEETSFSTDNRSSINQNHDFPVNNTEIHNIGSSPIEGGLFYNGYIAEWVQIDGTASAPTAFGEYDSASGIWKPIDVSGLTFGTNGFYLDFEASGNLGNDANGGTDFTLVNIEADDQAADIPTNSFCTLNPISYNVPYTSSEGNTKYVKSDGTYGMASGTHYVGAGKWYWEVKATDFGTYSACHFGILDAAKTTVSADERGYEDPSLAATNPEILAMSGAPNNWVMNSNATITNNGAMSSVDYTFNEGDILAIALDMDNGAFWFGNSRYSGVANGSFWVAPGGTTNSGNVAITDPTNGNYALVGDGGGTNNGTPNFNGGTITGGSLLTAGFTLVTPLIGAFHDGVSVTLEANFGGYNSYAEDGGYADGNGYGNFAYSVPSGFYALCTKNIAEFGGSG